MLTTEVGIVVALAYGTVGIAFWLVTQLRLSRVERRVSRRVVAAAEATERRAVEAVDGMEERIQRLIRDRTVNDGLKNELSAMLDQRMTELMHTSMAELLNEKVEELHKAVLEGVRASMLQFHGEQAKAIGKMLDDAGIPAAIEGELRERIPAAEIRTAAMRQLMSIKPPKRIKQQYPLLAAIWESQKLQLLDMLDTLDSTGRGASQPASATANREFRPGV